MPIKSFKVGPGELIFGAPGAPNEFSAQVTSATIEPSVDTEDDVPVLSGEVLPGEDEETAVLTGSLLQDITESGITTWTWENAGQVVPFVYIPNSELARQVTGEVKVRRTNIGGDVKTRAESDFEFPCIGMPDLGDVPTGP